MVIHAKGISSARRLNSGGIKPAHTRARIAAGDAEGYHDCNKSDNFLRPLKSLEKHTP